MPTVPAFVEDGDFSVIAQNGALTPSFPFADKGDFTSFVMRGKFRVNLNNWQKPIPMSQINFPTYGTAYLVSIGDPQTINESDLVDYPFVYASVPDTRTEYGSVSYTPQVPAQDASNNKTLLQYNDTFDAELVYEYSANSPLPQLFRGKLIKTAATFGTGFAQAGGWKVSAQNNNRQLAQNSTTRIYMGKIYERLSVFAKLPKVSGASISFS